MSEMIDRVAEALATSPRWNAMHEDGRRSWRVAARAAIEAMREPGEDFSTYLQLAHDLRPQDWSEVIDEALK